MEYSESTVIIDHRLVVGVHLRKIHVGCALFSSGNQARNTSPGMSLSPAVPGRLINNLTVHNYDSR